MTQYRTLGRWPRCKGITGARVFFAVQIQHIATYLLSLTCKSICAFRMTSNIALLVCSALMNIASFCLWDRLRVVARRLSFVPLGIDLHGVPPPGDLLEDADSNQRFSSTVYPGHWDIGSSWSCHSRPKIKLRVHALGHAFLGHSTTPGTSISL